MMIGIYKSKRKAVAITIASLIAGIGGALVLLYAEDPVLGWLLVISSLFGAILGIGSAADRKPYIILSENGITELSVIREEIGWDEIVYADDFFFRGQDFIRLLLDRKYKPETLKPTWFNRLDRLYAQQGVKALYIRTSGLEVNSARLLFFIRRMVTSDPARRRELLSEGLDTL